MSRKLVSMMLAIVMLLSITGSCAVAEEAQPYQFPKYDETITLSTYAVVNADKAFQEGDSAEYNGLTRWYEKNLGIKIKLDWVAADGTTNTQKMDLAFASDDLPDVIRPNANQLAKYVEAGKIQPLDDLIEQYATPLVKYVIEDAMEKTCGTLFAPVTFNGKIYAFPSISGTLAWWDNNFIRKDILDELGVAAPTSLDELEAICDLYIAKYPDKYPIMMNKDIMGTVNTFQAALTAYGTSVRNWTENAEGNLEYTSLQPETRAALERVHTWYEKGYIDPEFVVMDDQRAKEVIASGDWLFCHTGWGYYLGGAFIDMWNLNEDAEVIALPLLTSGTDAVPSAMRNTWFSDCAAVTTNCEHPEAVFAMINAVWDSRLRNNKEARAALAERGYIMHFPETEVQTAYNEQEINEKYALTVPSRLWKFNYTEEEEGPYFLNDYYCEGNIDYGIWGVPAFMENALFAELAAAGKDGDTSLLSADSIASYNSWYANHPKMVSTFSSIYDVNAETNYVANKFTTSNTATMAEKMAYLYKLEEECFTNVIMGNESIEAFDKFVSDWYANGGEQITKEVNDWYATTK